MQVHPCDVHTRLGPRDDDVSALALAHTRVEYLDAVDSAVEHEAACEARKWDPSSSTWILSHPQMKEWADSTVPTNPMSSFSHFGSFGV